MPRTSGLDSGQDRLKLTKAALLPKVKQQIPLQQCIELHITADPDPQVASAKEGLIFLARLTQVPFFFQSSELNLAQKKKKSEVFFFLSCCFFANSVKIEFLGGFWKRATPLLLIAVQ